MLRPAFVSILIILTVVAASAHAAVEFVYPAASSVVNRTGHLIVKFNQADLTSVRVTVNGLASEMIEVGSPEYRKLFQDFFIAQAMWDKGATHCRWICFEADKN